MKFKKTIYLAISILLFIFSINGCTQEYENNFSQKEAEALTWSQQLDLIKKNVGKVLTKSQFVDKSQLQLINYRYIGDIKTNEEIKQIKADFLLSNEESYFPFYNITNNKLELLTWTEISQIKDSTSPFTYSKSSLEEFLDTTIVCGLKKVELEWLYGSQIYKTLCLASETGVVYDNIISNMICISKEESRTLPIQNSKPPRLKSSSEAEAGTNMGKQWKLTVSCDWLWGSERGLIEIVHKVDGRDSYVIGSDTQATAYMSIGKTDAKCVVIERKTGYMGHSKCAYGYYFTTPFATVSMTFQNGAYQITIGGLGSEAKGSGTNTLRTT